MADDPHKSRYYSGKKPYLVHNYRTMMKKKTAEEYYFHELNLNPMSEQLKPYFYRPEVEGFGYEGVAPPGGTPYDPPGEDPDNPGGPGGEDPGGGGDCTLACNNSMLDCEGGCTTIICICGTPFEGSAGEDSLRKRGQGGLGASIKWDATGDQARITGTTINSVTVCIPDVSDQLSSSGAEYPSIGIEIVDGKLDIQIVTVWIIDCRPTVDCCDAFSLTGSNTINPGGSWIGTISPPCPGAACEVVSNSGCSITCIVDEAGSQVEVIPDPNDCGSFTVTVTEEGDIGDGCSAHSASKTVRINNTGQGGSWTTVGSPTNCTAGGTCCSVGSGSCDCAPIGGVPIGCTVDECRYNGVGVGTLCMCANDPACCTTPGSTRPCQTLCPNPCGQSCGTTCPAVSCNIPPGTWTGECQIQWNSQEWRCAC